jgi:hypothetical protein
MADTRFKVENGLLVTGVGANTLFEHRVQVNANLTVVADLLYVGGNLYVQGNSVIVGVTEYDTDIVPITDNIRSVGNTSSRWLGHFTELNVSTFSRPTTNNVSLGNTSRRWDAYATNADISGQLTVTGNTVAVGNSSIVGQLSVTNTASLGNTTVTGFVNASTFGRFGGNLTVGGTANIAGNATSGGLIFNGAALFANTRTVVGASQTVIDAFPATLSNFAKIYVTVTAPGGLYHSGELNIVHDGTLVLVNRYGELFNSSLGSFNSDINGSNIEIYFTGLSSTTYTVKTIRQQILA